LNFKPSSAASAIPCLNTWNTRVSIFSNHFSQYAYVVRNLLQQRAETSLDWRSQGVRRDACKVGSIITPSPMN
jgi:hypothetical protein